MGICNIYFFTISLDNRKLCFHRFLSYSCQVIQGALRNMQLKTEYTIQETWYLIMLNFEVWNVSNTL